MAEGPKETFFDFIIVGGGTAGCVVASRLHQQHPNLSIALIEAGPDASDRPVIEDTRAARLLDDTDLRWKYTTTPQSGLNGRQLPNWGGKLLSGSSAVNYTAWTRGNAANFDSWAKKVEDSRWSWESLLPAFKRSEHWHDTRKDATELHGFDGPVHTKSGDCGFPLRQPLKEGFEYAGFPFNPDINSGDPNGIAPLVITWRGLKRQHASVCYPLDGVHIMLDTLVDRVVMQATADKPRPRAIGVKLAGTGRVLHASKEVILSCGAIRTPQVLLLSGVGPAKELTKHGIEKQVDLPAVGQNLMDHPAVQTFWEIRYPDQGVAVGSEAFNQPSYANSLPMDWVITGEADDKDLERAAQMDKSTFEGGLRSDYELTPMYLTNGAVPKPWLSMDGKQITCGVGCMSPTSRGTVTLASADPRDSLVLDPQYLSTEHDRAVIRAGMRAIVRAMNSPALQQFVTKESPPPGYSPLTADSADVELDERMKALASSWFHAAGTVAMGEAVDTNCCVHGVQSLRVVDASIFPVVIAAHTQAAVYAIAEHAALIISRSVEVFFKIMRIAVRELDIRVRRSACLAHHQGHVVYSLLQNL